MYTQPYMRKLHRLNQETVHRREENHSGVPMFDWLTPCMQFSPGMHTKAHCSSGHRAQMVASKVHDISVPLLLTMPQAHSITHGVVVSCYARGSGSLPSSRQPCRVQLQNGRGSYKFYTVLHEHMRCGGNASVRSHQGRTR